MTTTVTGADVIARRLKNLRDQGAPKAALGGARAAAREFDKGIKEAIPGQYRSARKGIGRRVRSKNGEVVAKVGAGVGTRPKKARVDQRRAQGKPGVGLGKNNIHWAILGVKNRQTKAGKRRGSHTGFLAGIVRQGASRAEIRAATAMSQAVIAEVLKAVK